MTEALDLYRARQALAKNRKTPVKKQSIPAATRERIHTQPCRLCGRQPVEAHHIVPRSQFSRTDTNVHDDDNLMPLCHQHHQDHHTTTHRVPRDAMLPNEVEFVRAKMGDHWLDLWYPGTDHAHV